ncbi:MAG: TetR family transcriptional regulator, partial [Verrucomicrobiota bacterium JB025]|nr:TetR/AcrR family transcriptional regulator [Verrucomicrobiota bacterium JB025]
MRKPRSPRSKAKQKLITTAEKLFAEHGFDTISIRDITSAAKANVAAINYHFSSREDLVDLVITQNLSPLLAAQESALDSLASNRSIQPPDCRKLFEISIQSIVTNERSSKLPNPLYYRLIGLILQMDWNLLPDAILSRKSALDRRIIELLQRTHPEQSHDQCAMRYHFTCGATSNLLTHSQSIFQTIDGANQTLESHLDTLIDFATAGFTQTTATTPPRVPQPTSQPTSQPT